jgi:tryptophanyl-tRNA synthetase
LHYCSIDENVEDDDPIMIEKGIFPIPRADVGKVGKLIGTDGINKMSKSLNNTILITDNPKKVKKKLGQLYTGRQSMTDPGDPESSLMQYVDIFITDKDRAAELKDKYVHGDNIGDGHIKVEVAEAISELLAPMQERRAQYDGDDDTIIDIIRDGTARANIKTEETLAMAKEACGLGFFSRTISFGDST